MEPLPPLTGFWTKTQENVKTKPKTYIRHCCRLKTEIVDYATITNMNYVLTFHVLFCVFDTVQVSYLLVVCVN